MTSEVTVTYGQLRVAWQAVQAMLGVRLSVATALRLRRLAQALAPELATRDALVRDIMVGAGASEVGGEWVCDAAGAVVYRSVEDGAAALAQCDELAVTAVTLAVVPLTVAELTADGVRIEAAYIGALLDAGLLVEEA